jgi:hypothetical protein
MPHWPVVDAARRPRLIRRGQATEPAVLSTVERIPEILEALFLNEPDLTKAQLAELGRADTATLAKLSAHVCPGLCTAPPGP